MKIHRSHLRTLCVSSLTSLLVAGAMVSPVLYAQTGTPPGTRTLATGSGVSLAADAPNQYTVKSGDTLWDISKTFLNQPWYWPELWYLNPQIKNPHLIYPGDVLSLVTVDGQPRLMLTERGAEGARVVSGNAERLSPQVRSTPLNGAITTIPYGVISAFLSRPMVLSKEQVKSAPHIITMRDKHVLGAAGDDVYVAGLSGAQEGGRFQVMHVDEPLRDPDSNDLLGYHSVYVGTGSLTTNGDPAKLRLHETEREALAGDKVFGERNDLNLDFVPHAPAADLTGQIFALNSGVIAGRYQVVAINRGTRQGVENGHVFAIQLAGDTVTDRFTDGRSANPMYTPNGMLKNKVQLPDERVGTLMVFKTFERMSYALIMDADHPIAVGYKITPP